MAVDNITVITATLAPVFLLSGAAIFLGFVQERLFRVVDRIDAASASTTQPDGRAVPAAKAQRAAIRVNDERRLQFLRNSVLFGVLAMALTVLTAIILLVPSALPGRSVGTWPIWTFGAALVAFAFSLGFAVGDAFFSVRRAERKARAADARAAREGDA